MKRASIWTDREGVERGGVSTEEAGGSWARGDGTAREGKDEDPREAASTSASPWMILSCGQVEIPRDDSKEAAAGVVAEQ